VLSGRSPKQQKIFPGAQDCCKAKVENTIDALATRIPLFLTWCKHQITSDVVGKGAIPVNGTNYLRCLPWGDAREYVLMLM
jgi:hypothetical protein